MIQSNRNWIIHGRGPGIRGQPFQLSEPRNWKLSTTKKVVKKVSELFDVDSARIFCGRLEAARLVGKQVVGGKLYAGELYKEIIMPDASPVHPVPVPAPVPVPVPVPDPVQVCGSAVLPHGPALLTVSS